MNEKTSTSSKKRKTLSAILAIAMVLAMLLSGTLAFYFHSTVTNKLFSEGVKKVAAHDDFIQGENKDVYLENTGDTPVYVRIKLTESFTLDDKVITNELVHKPSTDPNADPAVGAGTEAEEISQYFQWEMGGIGDETATTRVHYFLSAKDPNYQTTGTYKISDGVAQDTSGRKWTADSEWADKTRAITRFAPDCEVLTMTQYKEKIASGEIYPDTFVGWVIDESDGWAYWSQRVETNSATGLLLNNVIVDEQKLAGHKYDYQIKVDFEAVDDTDIGIWIDPDNHPTDELGKTVTTDEASATAKQLLNYIQPLTADELDAKMEALEAQGENGSKGAAKLYEDARKRLTSSPLLARKLAVRGDLTRDIVEGANFSTYQTPLLDSDTPANGSITNMDTVVAKYLTSTYGEGHQLTRDQAMGVWTVDQSKASKTEKIQKLDGLTANNFPNLVRLTLQGSSVSGAQIEGLDSGLKAQIEELHVQRDTAITGKLSLAGFDGLQTFAADRATGLTEVTNFPLSLRILSLAGVDTYTQTSFDATKLPNLRQISLSKSYNNIVGLDTLPKLAALYVGGYPGDGSDMQGKLDLSMFEELKTIQILGCDKIDELLLPTKPNGEGVMLSVYGVAQPELTVEGSGLTKLDISKTKAWDKKAVALTDLSNLKLAIRNEGQKNVFTGWDSINDQVRYECVIQDDGQNAKLYQYAVGSTAPTQISATGLDAAVAALLPQGINIVNPS